jgi:hypothetical protein
VSELTPELWVEAMTKALDNYRQALAVWTAAPTDARLRSLQLAGRHVDHVEGLRPEPIPPAAAPTAASTTPVGATRSPRE